MHQTEMLQVAESLAGLIPRLARGLSSPERDPADELPLAQFRLCAILSEGPRPMSALSDELRVSLSALTQIADRLERARLVKRTAAENDRRVRCLQLTSRGEKMMRKRREARLYRSLAVVERLTTAERELVLTAIETLVAACVPAQTDPAARNGRGAVAVAAARSVAKPSVLIGRIDNGRAGNGHTRGPNQRTATTKKSKARISP